MRHPGTLGNGTDADSVALAIMAKDYARALREEETSGELGGEANPVVLSIYILYLEECARTKSSPRAEILDRATKPPEASTGRELDGRGGN